MKALTIVGVDVSKLTLDSTLLPATQNRQVANTAKGFAQWKVWVEQLKQRGSEVLVVMEHTGLYSYLFELFLQREGVGYVKKPAVEIKQSIGLSRGKSDRIDAKRIAQYGWMRRDQLCAEHYPVGVIMQMKDLLSYRNKLVRDRSGYQVRLKEEMETGRVKKGDFLYTEQQKDIAYLNTKIKVVEKKLFNLIRSSEAVHGNFLLLQSIKGVGKITAAYVIAVTNNFVCFTDPRKFNCYAGLAPFEHQSGKSIKGKNRVSQLANKTIKCLLRLSAFVAVRYNEELKTYYVRKVTEGKSKMSVLNVIGTKLVKIMFAVVKRQTPYIERLPPVAA
jgi:transposase